MKTSFIITLTLLFSIAAFSQNYKQVKIFIKDHNDIQTLIQKGLEIDHGYFDKDNSISVFVSDKEFNLLQQTGLEYEILINDWASYYASLPGLTESQKFEFRQNSKDNFNVDGFGFGSMGGFFTLNEVYARLDSMFLLYPNIITQQYSIGTSIQGRTIYAVKISDNPNVNESEPQVHINALIHAREPQSMMTVMYYMYYLLENYGTDPEVTYLVNNREIYFIPVINVDGYEYNRQTDPNGGGMWRKNRRNNGDGSYGVDLNRNFGYKWGYDNNGSSPYPSDETYRGTAPFSEPETQAIRDLVNSKNFKTALNYHTYGNYLLYPWGYINQPCPDDAIFSEFSTDMVQYNGYENGRAPVVLYIVNGSSDDWMYGEQITKPKIFGMTPEVGSTGFWPSQAEIYPLAQENVLPNLYYTWAAGEFINLINPSFSQQYFNPGDFVQLNIPQIRNKGLSDASNISLSLLSDNPLITINTGNINLGNILSRTTINNSQNLSFTIDQGMGADIEVKMIVTILTNGTPMKSDTLSFITGTPVFIFSDSTNDPAINWNITSTPANPKWEATTLSYHSAPTSFTDSKNGNYSNNATVTMSLKNALNLTAYQHPRLAFWTKYDIESNWDYGQVELSTNNGATWTPLQGLYTEPGTGSFQPNGEPLYDGTQLNWVREEIDLSGLNSSQVKLRYELKTDGSVTEDGWYVDDIGILIYSIVPVELSSFTVNAGDNKVMLNWITSTELNNLGFDVERKSLSGKSGWQKIGFVKGNGTTSDISEYSFTDNKPLKGKSLYRLKQIDFDGSYKIFNSIEVEFAGINEFKLENNYPNPFNPETRISYSIPQNSFVLIKVYDMLGNEVARLVDEQQPAGRYEVVFDGSDLSSGVYLYTMKAGDFTSTKKLVLMK
jgi:hypothetical protein